MNANKQTNLERTRVQMEYVAPLVRDLQDLLGNEVVNTAPAKRAEPRKRAQGLKADFCRMQAGTDSLAAGQALDYEVITSDGNQFNMDVSACAYSRMMSALIPRDIVHLLTCNLDFPPAVKLGMTSQRTQTKMQSESFCDFRDRRNSS